MTRPTPRLPLAAAALLAGLAGLAASASEPPVAPAPPAGPAAAPTEPAAGVSTPTGTGRLRGELRGPERQPIPGAQVAASRVEGPPVLVLSVSNDDGLVSVDGVPNGVYEARARAAGYLPGTVKQLRVGGPFRTVSDFVLKRGLAPQEDLTLAPPPAAAPAGEAGSPPEPLQTVSIQVTGERGQPVPGVLVRFQPEGHRADPAQARTGQDGRVTLGPLAPGSWRVLVYRAGWTRLAPPRLRWAGGPLTVIARILPTLERAQPTVDELVPPARLIPPAAAAAPAASLAAAPAATPAAAPAAPPPSAPPQAPRQAP
jgi:hypothetical protein